MSKVTISGNASGTGTFTIASPNSNTDRTLTLPDNTGTILTTATPGVPVNGPAFSAYASTNTALSAGVGTLIALTSELFDTNSCFNNTGSTVTLNGLSAPAYSFCPNVPGYYQVTGSWATNSGSAQTMYCSILRNNGSYFIFGGFVQTTGIGGICNVTGTIYLNGAGDYVQLFSTDTLTVGTTQGSQYTYFHGAMVRAA
jgi:hypothetical protein